MAGAEPSCRAHECGLCLDLETSGPYERVNVMMRVCALEEREREREVYN